jgi:hypothetical protein
MNSIKKGLKVNIEWASLFDYDFGRARFSIYSIIVLMFAFFLVISPSQPSQED